MTEGTHDEPAGLWPAFLLTVAVVVAASIVLAAAAMAVLPGKTLVFPPTASSGGFTTEQHQNAETFTYLGSFFVILPLALWLVPGQASRIAAGPNRRSLSFLASAAAAGLGVALAVARVSSGLPWGGGLGTAAILATIWLVSAALICHRAATGPWPTLMTAVGRPAVERLPLVAAILAGIVLVLGVTAVRSVSPAGFAITALLGGIVILATERIHGVHLSRRWGMVVDALVIAIAGLAVVDVVIFLPDGAASSAADYLDAAVYAFHQNFILGPASVVLGGGPVLVETASQYGVGPVYLAAGWGELFGLGYGTFGLLDGVLTALLYGGSYALMRFAGAPRPLAVATLLVAVIALVYNLEYPVGALPQHGPLRYGLPMVVVVALTAEARRATAPVATAIALAAVGLSAIWAIEAFLFTLGTYCAVRAFQAAFFGRGRRRLLREAGVLALVCVIAHVALALATLIAAGELPQWSRYLAFLDAFLGGLGDITYDFAPWTPGFAVAVVYLASAVALVLIGRRRRDVFDRDPSLWVAIAGITAYGVLLYSYFVDRSLDHVLVHCTTPAVLTVGLWTAAGLRHRPRRDTASARRILLAPLLVAALMVGAAWDHAGERLDQSALAHALPGGQGLRPALERLGEPPPIDPRAPAGEALARRIESGGTALITVGPDLQTEILIRAGLLSELPFSHPRQESFVPDEHTAALRDAAAGLDPGDLMLTEEAALPVFEALRRDSGLDPLGPNPAIAPLAPLQAFVLELIGRRYDLRVVRRGPQGLLVVRLTPRTRA